jgi:16S rRNA (guanine527-N7)-methyltransferase
LSERIEAVLRKLASDHRSLSSIRDPEQGRATHVADSLTGLEVPELPGADSICDIGAGAGFPGFVLADELPGAQVDLVESVSRKCAFMREAIEEAGFTNARVIESRSEQWATTAPPEGGREAYDVVTARAVARLATLAELAAPLLRDGGVLVAWKGKRDAAEEEELGAACLATAMSLRDVLEVGERAGFEHRHLYVLIKRGPTPEGLPRRPGLAKKRPLSGHPAQ